MANLWNLSEPSGSHMAAPHNQRELNWAGAQPAKNHAETSLFAHFTGKRKHEKGIYIYICLWNSSKSHLMPSITFIHENPLPLQCPSFTFNPKFVFWQCLRRLSQCRTLKSVFQGGLCLEHQAFSPSRLPPWEDAHPLFSKKVKSVIHRVFYTSIAKFILCNWHELRSGLALLLPFQSANGHVPENADRKSVV